MRMTIYVGGGAAMFVCLALLLAVPDIPAVLAGRDVDPVGTTLRAALGDLGFRAVIAVVLVSFGSCLLSLQAAASRLLFAYARDGMIVASAPLARMSPRTKVPVNALLVTGVVPAAIAGLGYWLEDALRTIISGAAIGIYIAFQMVIVGALVARARGWRPGGRFTLGAWGLPVNVAALLYGLGAVLNMLWPRAPDEPWYLDYAMLLFAAGVVGSGLIYLALARPHVAPPAPATAAEAEPA
jgi:amino acid transporter